MDIIKSKDNKTIKYISKLRSSSKFRHSENQFVVEGVRMCDEVLKNNCEVVYFVYSVSAYDKYKDIADKLINISQNNLCVEDRIFCALSDTKTPQGVLCVVKTLHLSR